MRSPRHLLALGLGLLCLAAAPAPRLLEVWLDGHNTGRVMAVAGQSLVVAAVDFAALNLSLPMPANDNVTLEKMPGLTARIDEANQRLLLEVAPAMLPVQHFDLGIAPPAQDAQSASGAILRYDLSGTWGDVRRGRSALGGANLGLDIFSPGALFTAGAYVTAGSGRTQAVGLDTAARFDDVSSLRHLVLGDAINGAPDYLRAVRFGGIQYASDFSLNPGLVTQPLPAFFGTSVVPATVEVFSGAAKMFESQVAPGPFALTSLPVVTGGGTATIVTTDVLGRQTSQVISLYTDAGLLAPGLSGFSLDAGFLRRGYGLSSFDYAMPMLSGDWRGGISDALTLQAHGEAAPHLALLGGGGEIGLDFGSLEAQAAISASRAGQGWLAGFSVHGLIGQVNLYGRLTATSAEYRDLASMDGLPPSRLRVSAGLTAGLFDAGTFGFGYLADRAPGSATHQYLSASWSRGLGRGWFASLSALRDIAGHATAAQLSLTMPLGGGTASLQGQSDNGRWSGFATYDAPADLDGGLGYRLLSGWQDGARLEGEAEYVGDHAAVSGGASLADRRVSLRAGMSGALVFLRGSLFASHDPGEAVALVRTGEPGIHITRENRDMGVSDADGEKLLTGLSAYAPNHLGVEARDFAFDTVALKTDAVVSPRRHAGLVADFTPPARHPVLAMVTRGIAMATPVGARVTLDGGDAPLPLGRDGELFLPDLQKPVGATVALNGASCRVYIAPATARGPMPRTPPLLCLREAQGAY